MLLPCDHPPSSNLLLCSVATHKCHNDLERQRCGGRCPQNCQWHRFLPLAPAGISHSLSFRRKQLCVTGLHLRNPLQVFYHQQHEGGEGNQHARYTPPCASVLTSLHP